MNKDYNHKEIEKNKNKNWIENNYFSTHDIKLKPFTIIMPPPNITGKLHIGHALDNVIQDVIIRFKKHNGYDTLFLPAMDHAGIATQAKIEQILYEKKSITKADLGRKKFIEEIYKWKDSYSKKIKTQWGKIGLALDYKKIRFTLDKEMNNEVIETFINLYNQNLIYKGKKAINWDIKLQTALSNIEVVSKETKSKFYYIKYNVYKSSKYIVVATTRPETMFSDVAIAINPTDEKYKWIHNKFVINPLSNKKIPIILDKNIDSNFGSGAVKISAHSVIDIDIINRNKNLEIIETIDKNGKLMKNTNEFFNIDRFKARELIYEKLNKNKQIEKVETIINNVSFSERTNSVIEILVSEQW